jgi:hypothetical protein
MYSNLRSHLIVTLNMLTAHQKYVFKPPLCDTRTTDCESQGSTQCYNRDRKPCCVSCRFMMVSAMHTMLEVPRRGRARRGQVRTSCRMEPPQDHEAVRLQLLPRQSAEYIDQPNQVCAQTVVCLTEIQALCPYARRPEALPTPASCFSCLVPRQVQTEGTPGK